MAAGDHRSVIWCLEVMSSRSGSMDTDYRLPVLTLEPTKLPRPLKNDVAPLLLRMALPANEPRAS